VAIVFDSVPGFLLRGESVEGTQSLLIASLGAAARGGGGGGGGGGWRPRCGGIGGWGHAPRPQGGPSPEPRTPRSGPHSRAHLAGRPGRGRPRGRRPRGRGRRPQAQPPRRAAAAAPGRWGPVPGAWGAPRSQPRRRGRGAGAGRARGGRGRVGGPSDHGVGGAEVVCGARPRAYGNLSALKVCRRPTAPHLHPQIEGLPTGRLPLPPGRPPTGHQARERSESQALEPRPPPRSSRAAWRRAPAARPRAPRHAAAAPTPQPRLRPAPAAAHAPARPAPRPWRRRRRRRGGRRGTRARLRAPRCRCLASSCCAGTAWSS
jgi:hypothetical protein